MKDRESGTPISTPILLFTPRLLLREWAADDWPLVYDLSREPLVTRFQSWLRLEDAARAQRWLQDAIEHNSRTPRRAYSMALIERASDAAIGWLGWGLEEGRAHSNFGFGYALAPSVWGHGYMTEAVRAALAYMFSSLEAQQVSAECAANNHASARTLEKAGLHLVSRQEETDPDTGLTEDYLSYAITRAGWRTTTKNSSSELQSRPGR
ncbi:MAG: GNAT family N-acetyltransferase [Roseiflexaceae bacterium]|nr:GNAT family N-acetyltransferase [Roseiflexaceae bacterium]